MELVIKLSDKEYSELQSASYHSFDKYTAYLAMKNGTPLPKHHGDLIDRQALIDNGFKKGFCNWYDEIKYANPVIKAEGSEDE